MAVLPKDPKTGKTISGQARKEWTARQEQTKANLTEAIAKQNAEKKAATKKKEAPKRPDVRVAKPMTGATRKPGDGPKKPDIRNGKPVVKKAAPVAKAAPAKPAVSPKAPMAKSPVKKPANKRIVV